MRVAPIVGRKLWFGPRRGFGWGWTPVSWEGWAAAGVAFVLIAVPAVQVDADDAPPLARTAWVAGVVVALVAICLLKGTSPGGPKKAEEFRRLTSR